MSYQRLKFIFFFFKGSLSLDKKWNFKNLSFNLYFEVQNFLAQPNPTPQEYGLNRNPDGTIIMPRNLVPVSNQEGNSSPLPTFGFVLFF